MKRAYKKALGFILVISLVGFYACGGGGDDSISNYVTTVFGSGNIVQETRSISGATGVDLRCAANLAIEQSATEELTLQTDDNLIGLIFTDVQNGILVIYSDPTVDLEPSQIIEASLTLIDIDSITLSGVGSISAQDLKTNQLELTLSGVGDIDIFNLDALTSDVLISGVGDISVTGEVSEQILTLNSIGEYYGENLSSETVDVEVAGIGSARVRVITTLNAHITGSGSVFYHGSPVVNRSGTGTGSVVQLSP